MTKPYYDHAGITIYCCDCRDILGELEPVDLVLTDPPYGIGWTKGLNKAAGSRKHDGIQNDHDTSARDRMLEMVAGVPAAVFGSFYAPFPANLTQVLVWQKPADAGVVGSVTGYRRDVEPVFLVGPWPMRTVKWPSVLRSSQNSIAHIAAQTGHPHTKPVDILAEIIGRTDAKTILDPFMGSGTTLVAAKQLGRRAIGIEIEEKYCEIAVRRLAQEVLDFGGEAA